MREYYTYILFDVRKKGKYIYNDLCFLYEPFYIGKGIRNRVYTHNYPSSKRTDKNSNKQEIISDILKTHPYSEITYIYKNKLTEKEALVLEEELIKSIGRLDLNEGVLTNLTDGNDGVSNTILEKTRKKVWKIDYESYEILDTYDSLTIASEENKLPISNISSCCRKLIVSCGGFRWSYYNDDNIIDVKEDESITHIIKYDTEYNLLSEYKSIKEACEDLNNKSYECLIASCKGRQRLYMGFIWEYKNLTDEKRLEYRKLRDKKTITKEIKCVYKDSGEVKIFESLHKASEFLGISQPLITRFCKGEGGKLSPYKLYYLNDSTYDDKIDKHHYEKYLKQKSIYQLNVDGIIIKKWNSMKDINEDNEFKNGRKYVRLCCQGKKGSFKGYKWSYDKP